MRRCRVCGVEKRTASFYNTMTECKACVSSRMKAAYAANPEKYRTRVARYQEAKPKPTRRLKRTRQRTPKQQSTSARGYGYAHQQERARLKPIVEAGNAYCAQPVCVHQSRWIPPGTPWALGHTDDRTGYLGPTHADCNQLDGASKGGRVIASRMMPTLDTPPCSQDW